MLAALEFGFPSLIFLSEGIAPAFGFAQLVGGLVGAFLELRDPQLEVVFGGLFGRDGRWCGGSDGVSSGVCPGGVGTCSVAPGSASSAARASAVWPVRASDALSTTQPSSVAALTDGVACELLFVSSAIGNTPGPKAKGPFTGPWNDARCAAKSP